MIFRNKQILINQIMSALAFNADKFSAMVNSNNTNLSLNLYNKNIDYCIGAYVMSKPRLSHNHKLRINNIRNRLRFISSNISTLKFNEDFNEQLYYYWHEVPFEGHVLNYNSINGYVSTLRTILDWSLKHGAEVTSTYSEFPREKEETTNISLSRHDLSHMYTFPLSALPYRPQCLKVIERVRDEFVLNCISYGLRYSDLSRLSDDHFQGDTLKIKLKKTLNTLINDGSLSFLHLIQREILSKYGSRDAIYKGNINNYNRHLKMLCKYLGGSFNDNIICEEKIDGEMLKIIKKKWLKMTSHVARHTFISVNLSEGKPITEVQHAVGHASTDMTGSYAVHVEN